MTDPGPPQPTPPAAVTDPVSAGYTELRRRIRQEGLMDRRPRYYALKIAVLAVLLAGGWAAFFALGDSWYQLLAAVYLAGVFGQAAFLGHEAGHRQIFRSRRGNDLVGLVYGNLMIGLSFRWWTGKHNRHPAYPNQEGKDPGGRLTETMLGGLNYQIEHHLFPSMPRPSLRRCRVLVRAFCAQTGLLYCETGLVSSYSQVLRHLHAAGQ